MSPKKLKNFILSNSYIVIYKKHQINNIDIDIDMSYYRNLSGHEEYEEQQQHSCEILDTSRYVSGNVSDSEESYDWDSLDSCVTPLAVLAVAECTTPPAIKPKPKSNPQLQHESCFDFDFDLTDPLRYCLERGEITHHEYDKWKIVQEEEEPRPQSQSQSKTRPDFGPGYNSDSDSDDEFTQSEPEPDINYTYGNGYLTRLQDPHSRHDEFYDPWFPNPDPTPNKQYTAIATNPRYMMAQFVVFESDPNDNHHHPASTPRLNHAFQLKLIWERFIAASNPPPQSPSPSPSLQTFWQTNALSIYEALQELVATQAKCFSPLSGARKLIPDTPEFHTTPVEMLENTFETIGRMSRCIAEEFNTQPVVNYVDEFIHALYTELRFMELVQGTPSPVSPLAYGTGDSVPRNPPGLRHRGLCPP